MRAAVFLDRDGTIVRDVDFLLEPAELELLPGAAEGLALLARAGYALVVVTNQSAIARGWLDEPRLARIHDELAGRLAARGVHLDLVLHCPHHPEHGQPPLRADCDCRKPRPGLIARAARELDLDLARSWVIGDSERDLEAGRALGLPGVLVATGKGSLEHERLLREGRPPEHFLPDLAAAARHVVGAELSDPA